jgi:hypothetical protein
MKKKSGNFVDNVPIQLAKKSFLKDSLDFVIGEEKNSGNSNNFSLPLWNTAAAGA